MVHGQVDRHAGQNHTDHRPWGVLGEDTVNVLDLNLVLETLSQY